MQNHYTMQIVRLSSLLKVKSSEVLCCLKSYMNPIWINPIWILYESYMNPIWILYEFGSEFLMMVALYVILFLPNSGFGLTMLCLCFSKRIRSWWSFREILTHSCRVVLCKLRWAVSLLYGHRVSNVGQPALVNVLVASVSQEWRYTICAPLVT